jgi:hypothetical protein
MTNVPPLFAQADVVHTYTRREALADGTLIDLTEEAREAGIRHPVAITSAAFHCAIAMTDVARRMGCDERGRRWDTIWMLRCAMGRARPGADTLTFQVLVVRDREEPELIELRAMCGPGDSAAPVLTLMLPDES